MGGMCDKDSNDKSPMSSMIQITQTPNRSGNVSCRNLENRSQKTTQVCNSTIALGETNDQTLLAPKSSHPSDDFVILALLGQGGFGMVFKVRKKDNKRIYAMKQIDKKKIFQHKLQSNILLERNVLKQSKHPFIVQLKYAFQTKSKICLVMEYVGGGEFYNILKEQSRRDQRLPESVVRFVAAEVVLGLEYLNTKLKVIYRDLKPENLLLTTSGHVKITDFGLATLRKDDEQSFTIAGTPEYLAPEIITSRGHSFEVDIWTLGVLIYEMLNGYPPFSDPQRRIENIEKQILANQPKYPAWMSQNSVDLIQRLLRSNPKERLGVVGGYQEIKSHPFFEGIRWDHLYNLQGASPLKTFAEQNAQKLEQQQIKRKLDPAVVNTPGNNQSADQNINGITFTGDGQTYNSKL